MADNTPTMDPEVLAFYDQHLSDTELPHGAGDQDSSEDDDSDNDGSDSSSGSDSDSDSDIAVPRPPNAPVPAGLAPKSAPILPPVPIQSVPDVIDVEAYQVQNLLHGPSDSGELKEIKAEDDVVELAEVPVKQEKDAELTFLWAGNRGPGCRANSPIDLTGDDFVSRSAFHLPNTSVNIIGPKRRFDIDLTNEDEPGDLIRPQHPQQQSLHPRVIPSIETDSPTTVPANGTNTPTLAPTAPANTATTPMDLDLPADLGGDISSSTKAADMKKAQDFARALQRRMVSGSKTFKDFLPPTQPSNKNREPPPQPTARSTPNTSTNTIKVPGVDLEISDGEGTHETVKAKFERLKNKRKRTDAEEIEFKRARNAYEQSQNRRIERPELSVPVDIDTDSGREDENDDFDNFDAAAVKAQKHVEKARLLRQGAAARKQRDETFKKVKSRLEAETLGDMKKEAEKKAKKGASNQQKANKDNDEGEKNGKKSKKRRRKTDSHVKLKKDEEGAGRAFKDMMAKMWGNDFDLGNGDDDGDRDGPNFKNRTNRNANRMDALKDLIADIPQEDRREARNHTKELDKAAKAFPRRFVKPDNEAGYWKVKGLKTSLRHHQLIGSGFMLRRENGSSKPLSGMLCDSMGLGKTLQTIALMLAKKADPKNPQGTLVVCPVSVVDEWLNEITKHVDPRFRGHVMVYAKGSRPRGLEIEEMLESCFCVITSYSELIRSLDGSECPNELATQDQVQKWYAQQSNALVGPLHRVKWHRVVLDEAHLIKNYKSITARACFMLEADHRWCLTGSPLVNDILETYSYLKFIRLGIAGSREQFVTNFKGGEKQMRRMQELFSAIMLRRNYDEMFLKQKIISLPPHTRLVTEVDFSRVERTIYDIFKHRMASDISLNLKKKHRAVIYKHVLKAITHLRTMTAHFLLGAGTLSHLLTLSDREKINAVITESQESGEDYRALKVLRQEIIKSNNKHNGNSATIDEELDHGGLFGQQDCTGQEALHHIDGLADVDDGRDVCKICMSLLEDPVVKTSCGHYFCEDCLEHHAEEAALNEQARMRCAECDDEFESSEIVKVKWKTPRQKKKEKGMFRENKDMSWIEEGDRLIPSAKLLAVKAQVQEWFRESKDTKIIIYTQWVGITKCLKRLCRDEDWPFETFTGKMNAEARDDAKKRFINDPAPRILIASLKCGSVGLNLTAASRIINIDLWFNLAVEQQAWSRIYRIGQTKETQVQRMVVRNSIDETLLQMQERKRKEIEKALGDDKSSKQGNLCLEELLSLFGTVKYDEAGNPIELDPFVNPDYRTHARSDLEGVDVGGERGIRVAIPEEKTEEYRPFSP